MEKISNIGGNHYGGCRRLWVQQSRIKRLTDERDKYRSNTETLLQDVRTYQTKDSLNAAKVGNLELQIIRIQKIPGGRCGVNQIVADKEPGFAKGYDGTNGNDKRITGERPGIVLYNLPGDTVTTVLRCIDIVEPWFELHGCTTPAGVFTGTHINRDSLLIAETVQYKRFLGFLWKTKKDKEPGN